MESSTFESGGISDPLAAVRDTLTAPEFPFNLPVNVPSSFRRNAARALLSDFADSVQAARDQVNAMGRSLAGLGVPLLNAVDGELSSGSFPPLKDSHGPISTSRTAGNARKRITPSRVPDSERRTSSVSFGENPVMGCATLQHEKAFSSLSSRKANTFKPFPESVPQAQLSRSVVQSEFDLKDILLLETIKRTSSMHAVFILQAVSSDHTTTEVLVVLAEALCLYPHANMFEDKKVPTSPARGIFGRLGDAYSTGTHLCAHAIQVLTSLKPLLCLLPAPLLTALAANRTLNKYAPASFQEQLASAAFPLAKDSFAFADSLNISGSAETPWNGVDPKEYIAESAPRRLSANIEASWDKLIDLQRIYRGDNSQIPAGTLDRYASSRTLSDLHPANVDAFASRLLKLLLVSASPREEELDRRKRLSLRMTASREPKVAARSGRLPLSLNAPLPQSAAEGASNRNSTNANSGVVLHRIPAAVRTMFLVGSAEAFFLDLVDVVDSAKLNDAMMPRLSLALHNFLREATSAESEESFTDAILQARVTAKLLAVTMHCSNWAYSSHSFSGDTSLASDHRRANKLPSNVNQRRATLSSAIWKSCVDLTTLLHTAIATKHGPTVFAIVLVTDIFLRIANIDSVSSRTDWFTSCLDVLFDLLRNSFHGKDKQWGWLVRTPIIRFAIEDLFKFLELSHTVDSLVEVDIKRDAWFEVPNLPFTDNGSSASRFGDVRLLSACSVNLADVRRILSSGSGMPVQSSVKPRRIRPSSASALTVDGEMVVSESAEGALSAETSLLHTAGIKEVTSSSAAFALDNFAGDAVGGGSAVALAVRRELWRTFQRGLDKRVRDVAYLVLRKEGLTRNDRSINMKNAARLLLPDVPLTVVEVTAQHCAHVRSEIGKTDREPSDNPMKPEDKLGRSPGFGSRVNQGADYSSAEGSHLRQNDNEGLPLRQLMATAWSTPSCKNVQILLEKTSLKVGNL